jgi:hypothetical protein
LPLHVAWHAPAPHASWLSLQICAPEPQASEHGPAAHSRRSERHDFLPLHATVHAKAPLHCTLRKLQSSSPEQAMSQ